MSLLSSFTAKSLVSKPVIKVETWHCHCCIAVNSVSDEKCCVCGRSSTYADSIYLPIHGTGAVMFRPNQVSSVVDSKSIHNTTNVDWTSLHYAASCGNLELVRELVNQGSLIEAKTEQGHTPLHLAVNTGNINMCSFLISQGADVNLKTYFEQNSSLHIAVTEGWRELSQYLVDVGADVNGVNAVGRTPLHICASTGRVDIASFLLSKHANQDSQDVNGWNPRQVAEFHGHSDFEELLVRVKLKNNRIDVSDAPPGQWQSALWVQVKSTYQDNFAELKRYEEISKNEIAKNDFNSLVLQANPRDITVQQPLKYRNNEFYDKNGLWRRKRNNGTQDGAVHQPSQYLGKSDYGGNKITLSGGCYDRNGIWKASKIGKSAPFVRAGQQSVDFKKQMMQHT